jgi:hypothetical protein
MQFLHDDTGFHMRPLPGPPATFGPKVVVLSIVAVNILPYCQMHCCFAGRFNKATRHLIRVVYAGCYPEVSVSVLRLACFFILIGGLSVKHSQSSRLKNLLLNFQSIRLMSHDNTCLSGSGQEVNPSKTVGHEKDTKGSGRAAKYTIQAF